MRIILLFFSAFLLVSCEQSPRAEEEQTVVQEAPEDDTIYTEEDLEAAKEEVYQEGYDTGYSEGYEIGNEEGYSEGMNIGMESGNSFDTPTFSSGLSLFSDKLDWDIATEFDKKEFVRSALESEGEIVTYSELSNYVRAIDMYYQSNSGLDTLKDALDYIR